MSKNASLKIKMKAKKVNEERIEVSSKITYEGSEETLVSFFTEMMKRDVNMAKIIIQSVNKLYY